MKILALLILTALQWCIALYLVSVAGEDGTTLARYIQSMGGVFFMAGTYCICLAYVFIYRILFEGEPPSRTTERPMGVKPQRPMVFKPL